MNKNDILEITLKILGIYMLTIAIKCIFNSLEASSYIIFKNDSLETSSYAYLTVSISQSITFSIISWISIFKPLSILKYIKFKDDGAKLVLNLDKKDMLQIMFCGSGVIILFFAINDFISDTIFRNFSYTEMEYTNSKISLYLSVLTIPLIKLIIGLVFILKSKYIANLVDRK